MEIVNNSDSFLVNDAYHTDAELELYEAVGIIEKKKVESLSTTIYRIKASMCKSIDLYYSKKYERYFTYVTTHNDRHIIVII